MVVHSSHSRHVSRFQSRLAAIGGHQLTFQLFYSTLVQSFDPHSAPPKMVSSFKGIEASKSKNPLGNCFVGQNNEFTWGWTPNAMQKTPKKRGLGGVYGVRACA